MGKNTESFLSFLLPKEKKYINVYYIYIKCMYIKCILNVKSLLLIYHNASKIASLASQEQDVALAGHIIKD